MAFGMCDFLPPAPVGSLPPLPSGGLGLLFADQTEPCIMIHVMALPWHQRACVMRVLTLRFSAGISRAWKVRSAGLAPLRPLFYRSHDRGSRAAGDGKEEHVRWDVFHVVIRAAA